MMYRDDSSQSPEPHQAMVAETHHPGDALMVQGNGAPTTPLAIAGPAPASQDVLRGGMDAGTFLHAMRRRWLLAVCMGLVVSGTAAIALWFLFPESSSATALFEVRNEQQSIIHDASRHTTQDFEILKKTQLALLKSKFVLTSALVNPGIASLSILAGERDKEGWLQDNLDVEFPQNGEILSISLSGSPPEDLSLLVDAVAAAYKKEVLGEEKARKLAIRDMLEQSLQNLNSEIKRKFEDYIDIAKSMGRATETERDPATELLLRDIADTQRKRDEITSAMYQLQTNYMVAKGQANDPALLAAQVDELLKQDPQIAFMQQQLNYALMQQMQNANSSKRGGPRTAQQQVIKSI